MGRKDEIWHKDGFMDGDFTLTESHSKLDVGTISRANFTFCPYFSCKDNNVKFSSLKALNLSHTSDTRKLEERDISEFRKVYPLRKNWTPKFGLTASVNVQCSLLPLANYLSKAVSLLPLSQENRA